MATAPVRGEEHWTARDGDVRLFLFNKASAEPAPARGTIPPGSTRGERYPAAQLARVGL
jgi:hypothetical protein